MSTLHLRTTAVGHWPGNTPCWQHTLWTPAAWLQVWPKDALEAVAYKFLKEMDLTDDVRGSLVELCQSVHRMVSCAKACGVFSGLLC